MAAYPSSMSLSLGSFGATVTSHLKPLPVYQVERTDKKVTCYIESQGGGQFRVLHLNNSVVNAEGSEEEEPRPLPAYDVSTYVDGQKVGGVVYGPGSVIYQQPQGSARMQEIKGRQSSEKAYQPFIFGQPEQTDDQLNACTSRQLVAQLGTIQVRVCRIDTESLEAVGDILYNKINTHTYEEGAIKGKISHQCKLATPIEAMPERRVSFELIDQPEDPVYTFEFKYRSHAMLESLGLVEPLLSDLSELESEREQKPAIANAPPSAPKKSRARKPPSAIKLEPSSPSRIEDEEDINQLISSSDELPPSPSTSKPKPNPKRKAVVVPTAPEAAPKLGKRKGKGKSVESSGSDSSEAENKPAPKKAKSSASAKTKGKGKAQASGSKSKGKGKQKQQEESEIDQLASDSDSEKTLKARSRSSSPLPPSSKGKDVKGKGKQRQSRNSRDAAAFVWA